MNKNDLSEYIIKENEDLPLIKKFAFLGSPEVFHKKLHVLENLAEHEKWVFKEKNQNEIYVLFNYVIHTFDRCFNQNKVTIDSDNKVATFNTGLMTPNGEDIFGVFTKNKFYEEGSQKRNYWYLRGFFKTSDRWFMSVDIDTPPIATYFDDYNELFFNADAEIVVNFDHIIEDNFDRLPQSLQTLPDKIYINQILNGVLEDTKKRIKRNARIPVPQFYKGQIMFLLPLKLQDDTIVLAVEKYSNKYRANTIFTLGMAYNCARLLSRPETNWLLSGEN